MNPQSTLGELRDIHLPETGGFWPPAPGWWLFALCLLLVIAAAVWFIMRRHRKCRWLRLARRQLGELESRASRNPQWFAQLNTLLKQAARERYRDQHPEALSGDDWIRFLLQTSPDGDADSRQIVEAIVHSAWQPATHADPILAISFARQWLGGQKC